MRTRRSWLVAFCAVCSLASLCLPSSDASAELRFSAGGGTKLGGFESAHSIQREGFLFGAEVAWRLLPSWEVGVFYELGGLSNSAYGANPYLHFAGALARLYPLRSSLLFFEGKLGSSYVSYDASVPDSGRSLGAGVGVGLEIPLNSHWRLGPKVSMQFLPEARGDTRVWHRSLDMGVLLSFII